MSENCYELYQIKSSERLKDRQFRPYRYLREHGIRIRSDDYDLVLQGEYEDNENVMMLRERLEQGIRNKEADILCINVGDIIAVTKDGLTTAYYVDPTKLILIPDFFHQSASGTLITIDSENLPLDGRKGSWMTVDTLRVDGRNLFLMQSQDYGRDAPYVVVDEEGREVAADKAGFTEATIEQIRESLKAMEEKQIAEAISDPAKKPKLEIWQQYFENGEYLRAAEITEEQNYNMIDGTLNNRAPRRSVIKRLQEKQYALAREPSHDQALNLEEGILLEKK